MTSIFKHKSAKATVSFLLAVIFCVTGLTPAFAAEETAVSSGGVSLGFDEYIEQYADAEYPEIADMVCETVSVSENVEQGVSVSGVENAYRIKGVGSELSFKATVGESGLYAIKLSSLQMENVSKASQFTVYVNGKVQNRQTELMTFPRKYKDVGEIKAGEDGNDIRPDKTPVSEWVTFYIADHSYNVNGFMPFYLESGENEIKLVIDSIDMYITAPVVCQPKDAVSYADYLKANDALANNAKDFIKIYQAEKSSATSSTELYPTYDRVGAATVPNDPYLIKLNTIGQSTWDQPGQWIEWEIEVEEDGYYNIGMRARQNVSRGVTSNRRLYIDGEVRFDECNEFHFPYDMKWYQTELGDKNGSYKFYLTKGKHTIRLEAVIGELGERIISLEGIANDLSSLYRSIIMITGTSTSVDSWRDYMLEEQIPNLTDTLKSIKKRINEEIDLLDQMGIDGESNMSSLLYLLDIFLKDDERIPQKISDLRNNTSTLSAWAQSLKTQPLELDYIYVKSEDEKAPETKGGFFASLAFRFKMLLASYVTDYSNMSQGVKAKEHIRVWTSSGRDQAQAILDLINNRFTPENNISVSLSIMQSGINESVAAGRNPDVLMHVSTTIVQLAARDVLADFTEYKNFDNVKSRFSQNAFIPYSYKGGIYGVPLDQSPLVMFYRKDILAELGLSVPKTWDEFMETLTVLQNNKLTVGLYAGTSTVPNINLFELLVYQKGGKILSDDLKSTALDDEKTYDAFRQWTEFFTKRSLEPEVQYFERFRSGEIPLTIQSVSAYAQLNLGAPEINGLWDMAPVPQTVREDGSLSNVTVGTYTPVIVFKNDNEEACFKFVDWLTSAETQEDYGRSIESLLGIGARYFTANIEAMQNLNWSAKESALIKSQMECMTTTPVVPADYYIARNVSNAFRRVYNKGYHPRESILMYKEVIDSEITRKDNEIERQSERKGK